MGYEKITLTPGLNMIGNQFLGVGNGTFQNINKMFAENSELVAGGDDSEADSILVWDGSSYSKVYYYDSWDNQWYDTDNLEDPIETAILSPAMGFWYKHKGTGGTLVFKRPFTIAQ